MTPKNIGTIKRVGRQVIFYALLVAAWQLVFYFGTAVLRLWKPYAFPNPIGVWRSFVTLAGQNALAPAVLLSLRRVAAGYLLSLAIGAAAGLILTRYRSLSAALKPLLLGIQALPSVCWVPFAILWFGLSEASILFVIVMGTAFSFSIAVESAIRNVNPLYIKAARTMGARGGPLYFKVVLPACLPALITGLKQSWSFAWRALMNAEVMSAAIGIGQMLMMGRDLADINRVALIIVIIILIGALIEKYVFSLAEERVLKSIGL